MNQKGFASIALIVVVVFIFIGAGVYYVSTKYKSSIPNSSTNSDSTIPMPEPIPVSAPNPMPISEPIPIPAPLPAPIFVKVSPDILEELQQKGSAPIIVQTKSGQIEAVLRALNAKEFLLGRKLYDYPNQGLVAFSGRVFAESALEKLSKNDAVVSVQQDKLDFAQ